MKKYLAMFLTLMMIFPLTSCGDTPQDSPEPSSSVSESATEEPTTEPTTTTVSFEEEFDIFDISKRSENITLKDRYYINYMSMEFPMNSEHKLSFGDDVFEKSGGGEITIRIEKNNDFDNNEDYLRSRMEKYGFDTSYTICKNNNDMILLMSSTCTNREEVGDIGDVGYDYKKLRYAHDFTFLHNGYEFTIIFSDDFSSGQAYKVINTLQLEDTFAEEATTIDPSTIDEMAITTELTEQPTEKPTSPPVKPTEQPTNPPVIVQKEEKTVYYTETGSKYHYDIKCGRGTYYPCTLDEALAKGLEPCKKCTEAN